MNVNASWLGENSFSVFLCLHQREHIYLCNTLWSDSYFRYTWLIKQRRIAYVRQEQRYWRNVHVIMITCRFYGTTCAQSTPHSEWRILRVYLYTMWSLTRRNRVKLLCTMHTLVDLSSIDPAASSTVLKALCINAVLDIEGSVLSE